MRLTSFTTEFHIHTYMHLCIDNFWFKKGYFFNIGVILTHFKLSSNVLLQKLCYAEVVDLAQT